MPFFFFQREKRQLALYLMFQRRLRSIFFSRKTFLFDSDKSFVISFIQISEIVQVLDNFNKTLYVEQR